jgi:hypothetical protein
MNRHDSSIASSRALRGAIRGAGLPPTAVAPEMGGED